MAQSNGLANQTAGKINATYLQNHFMETSGAETTRLQLLVSTLKQSTMQEVIRAVRDWSGSYKPGPDATDAEKKQLAAKRAVVQTRGSEVKVLKAAMDTGFNVEPGKAYHAAIASCRAVLAEKGLTNAGKPQVDRLTRDQKRKALVLTTKALELAGNDVSKVNEQLEQAADDVAHETARKLAQVIVQRHGLEIAGFVAEIIPQMIHEIQTAQANAEAEAKFQANETEAVNIPQAAAA